MSKKMVKHRVTVRKYNRHPGLDISGSKQRWWADCTCGWFQGNFDKQDSLDMRDKHLAEKAT